MNHKKTAVINANIVLKDHYIPDGIIIMEDGIIKDFDEMRHLPTPEDCEVIDAGGNYAGPGFIDIHTHASDVKFFTDDPLSCAEHHLEHGTTSVYPALYFSMNTEQYVAARNLRYSEVRSAEAKVLVARSEVERAERYYNRLMAADDRGITANERDVAETTLASVRAELNSANAAVEQAKAAAAIADFNLKHTKVHSPIAGRIGKTLHHVGDYVSPSKSPLARVVQLDPIRVTFPITDRDYDAWQAAAERGGAELKDSRRLRLRLPNGEVYGAEGVIDFGDNEMSRTTGTLVMYVSFANPKGRLVPNAFVRVLSDERHPAAALTVPAGAAMLTDDGMCAWTLDDESRAHPVKVEVGTTWDGRTEVKKGLSEGQRVVTVGGFKLHDGTKVRVVGK